MFKRLKLFALLVFMPSLSFGAACPQALELIQLTATSFTICSPKETQTVDSADDSVSNMRAIRTDNATFTDEWYSYHADFSGIEGYGTLTSSREMACMMVADLSPATAYLVDVQFYDGVWTDYTSCQATIAAIDCTAFPSNCGTADADGVGAGTDVVLEITTLADPGAPLLPVAPTHARSYSERSLDSTTTVTVTAGACQNLQALLTAKAADGTNQTHGIKIPANEICRPEDESTGVLHRYTIPDLTSSGNCLVLYSEYPDPDAGPPPNGIIDDDAAVGAVEQNTGYPLAEAVFKFAGTGAQCFETRLLRIGRPAFSLLDYTTLLGTLSDLNTSTPDVTFSSGYDPEVWGKTITDSTTQFTVYDPGANSQPFRSGLWQQKENDEDDYWNPSLSETVITPGQALTPVDDGTSSGANGTIVSKEVTRAFTSATTASQPVLTFSKALNFDDGKDYPLTSISSGIVTVTAGAHIYEPSPFPTTQGTLYVTSAIGTGCNDVHVITAHNTSAGTFTIDDTSINCTSGNAKVVYKAYLHDVSSNVGWAGNNATCLFSVETQTTIKLLKCTQREAADAFTPDFTSVVGTISGFLSFAPPRQPPLIDLSSGVTNYTCDRCILDGGEKAYITRRLVDVGAASNIIFNGARMKGSFTLHVDPLVGRANNFTRQNNYGLAEMIHCTGCSDIQVLNTVVETAGFFFMNPNDVNIGSPTDLSFKNVTIFIPPNRWSSSNESGGAFEQERQQIEFKNAAQRVLIDGFSVYGQVENTTSSPWAITCQNSIPAGQNDGDTFNCESLDIKNFLISGMKGVSVRASDQITGSPAYAYYKLHSRIRVDNGLFLGNIQRSKPSNEFLRDTGNIGSAFHPDVFRFGTIDHLTVTNITYGWTQNNVQDYKPFIQLDNGIYGLFKAASVKITNNAIVFQDANTFGYNVFRTEGPANNWTDVEALITQDGAASASATLSNNVLVPCTSAPTDEDYTTPNNAHTTLQTWLTEGGSGYSTNWPEVVGAADSTPCNTNLDLQFEADSWQSQDSKGADIEAILDSLGRLRNVVAEVNSSTGSFRLSFTAPSADDCYLAYASGSGVNFSTVASGVTRQVDSTGLTSRTMEVTGVGAGTYSIKLACKGFPVLTEVTIP